MAISYSFGIAKDSSNTPPPNCMISKSTLDTTSQTQMFSFYSEVPQRGFTEYYPVELVGSGVANVSSSANTTDCGGIYAMWRC